MTALLHTLQLWIYCAKTKVVISTGNTSLLGAFCYSTQRIHSIWRYIDWIVNNSMKEIKCSKTNSHNLQFIFMRHAQTNKISVNANTQTQTLIWNMCVVTFIWSHTDMVSACYGSYGMIQTFIDVLRAKCEQLNNQFSHGLCRIIWMWLPLFLWFCLLFSSLSVSLPRNLSVSLPRNLSVSLSSNPLIRKDRRCMLSCFDDCFANEYKLTESNDVT